MSPFFDKFGNIFGILVNNAMATILSVLSKMTHSISSSSRKSIFGESFAMSHLQSNDSKSKSVTAFPIKVTSMTNKNKF